MKNLFICTLFSSSRGNVTYIRNRNDEFLIDAGASARSIENSLRQLGTSLYNIRAIFITHEHGDHIRGLNIISKNFKIPVYAPLLSTACIKDGNPCCVDYLINNDDGSVVNFCETSFTAFRTPHDSAASVCYRLDFGNRKLGYATDIGHVSEKVLLALTGCDYIIIESNHDLNMLKNGPYPYSLKKRIISDYGHLSNISCANMLPFLVNKGAAGVLLAHLSPENNRPDIAFNENHNALLQKGMTAACEGCTGDVRLGVAAQCGVTVLADE